MKQIFTPRFDLPYKRGLRIAKAACKTLDSKLNNHKYVLTVGARRKLELHIADVLFTFAYRVEDKP